jgi:hypothetical protein
MYGATRRMGQRNEKENSSGNIETDGVRSCYTTLVSTQEGRTKAKEEEKEKEEGKRKTKNKTKSN